MVSLKSGIDDRKAGIGLIGLVAASLVVAIAIVADGQIAKSVNGVAGLLWIGSLVVLVRARIREDGFGQRLGLCACLTLVLVLVAKPSDYLSATIGFSLAGALIAMTVKDHSLEWSMLVPALWLPVHLLVAVGRVVERSIRDLPTHVRSDPPPTSAFVPFVMVVATFMGGLVVSEIRNRGIASKRLKTQL